MQVKLSTRLQMSADLVDECNRVADVGCDHAHTCIWLLQHERTLGCIGMDVRTGPLKKAAENLELYGCSSRVDLRLSFGLDELRPGEADAVVIAGMGGEMIRDILERDLSTNRVTTTEPTPQLILQPHSHVWDVRRWLCGHGYIIVAEDMCREDDKFYPAIKAVRLGTSAGTNAGKDSGPSVGKSAGKDLGPCAGTSAGEDLGPSVGLSPVEIYYGPCLIEQKHPVLKEFLEIEYRKKKHLLEQIDKSSTPKAAAKRAEVEEVFMLICKAIDILGCTV